MNLLEFDAAVAHAKAQEDDNVDINQPAHYLALGVTCEHCKKPVEPRRVIRQLNANLGFVVKYVWRCDFKGRPLRDLKKAANYLNDEIKRREELEIPDEKI